MPKSGSFPVCMGEFAAMVQLVIYICFATISNWMNQCYWFTQNNFLHQHTAGTLIFRSHKRCSLRKSVIRNFAEFTGKHLCHSLILNKVAGLRSTTFLKKRLWHRSFAVNLAEFLRTPFSQRPPGDCFLWYHEHAFLRFDCRHQEDCQDNNGKST